MMRLLGIDPGLQGSLVSIQDRVVSAWRMPLCDGGKSRIDILRLADIIGLAPSREGPDLITMEACQPMPKQGVTSMFNYGATYGATLAIVSLSRFPFRVVSPQAWKRLFSLNGKEKEESVLVACRLVPALRSILYDGEGKPLHPRVVRISMSEAALLALSGNELSRNH